ncbi:MAG TPA: hypothetical protein VIU62_09015 [Chloroflexota bacterium]
MMAATSEIDPHPYQRWLAAQADWIAANSRATELGRRARRAYLDRNQMRNLQRVAETAAAVSTLLDYVKVQTGKQPLWRRENFGPMLLDDLERLQTRAGHANSPSGSPHLDLCRIYVRQIAAAYSYSIAVDTTAPRVAAPPPRPAPPARDTARPPRQRAQRAGGPRAGRGDAAEAAGGTDQELAEVDPALPEETRPSVAAEDERHEFSKGGHPDAEGAPPEEPDREEPSERFEQSAVDQERSHAASEAAPPDDGSASQEGVQ